MRKSRTTLVLLSMCLHPLLACAPPVESQKACIVGSTEVCECEGGLSGTRECGDDRTFGYCDCGGSDVIDTETRDVANDPRQEMTSDADQDPDTISNDSTDTADSTDVTDTADDVVEDLAEDFAEDTVAPDEVGIDETDAVADVSDADAEVGDETDADETSDIVTDSADDVDSEPEVCVSTSCAAERWECGTQAIGCGNTEFCGTCPGQAECTSRHCFCAFDDAEYNGAISFSVLLDDILFEDDDTQITYDSDFWLHDGDDVDWFKFEVDDVAEISPTTDVQVTLSGIPEGADYNLSVYFDCAGENTAAGASCTTGAEDDEYHHGCRSASSGNADETVELIARCVEVNDSGTAYVRVESFVHVEACVPYELFIRVH